MQGDALNVRLDRGEIAYGVVTAWPDPDLVGSDAGRGRTRVVHRGLPGPPRGGAQNLHGRRRTCGWMR